MAHIVFFFISGFLGFSIFLPPVVLGTTMTFVDACPWTIYLSGVCRAQSSDPTHSSNSLSVNSLQIGGGTTPTGKPASLGAVGEYASAEADLRQNTSRVLAVDAGGGFIIPFDNGGWFSQGGGFYAEAYAQFNDAWTFSHSCLGGPCTQPWSFQIATDVKGLIYNDNSKLPSVVQYSVIWGGNFGGVLANTMVGGLAPTGGGINVQAGWGQVGNGTQLVNESGIWTFTLRPTTTSFTLLPTVFLRAQAGVGYVPHANNDGSFISARANFFNSAGFTFNLPDDVTFSSASGVRAASAAPAAVPEPSTMLLLGSGLAGLTVWRFLKSKPA